MADSYLNKKAWHPGSTRNRERVWLAEQEHLRLEKEEEEKRKRRKEERDRELDLVLLASDDLEKTKRRGGVAWMYEQGPPGTSFVSASASEDPKATTAAASGVHRSKGYQETDARAEARVAKMLDGIRRSGTAGVGDGEYAFFGCQFEREEDEEDAWRLAMVPERDRQKALKRMRRKERKRRSEARRREVAEAERVLREAGIQ